MTVQIFSVKVLKFYNNLSENDPKVILHIDINDKELIYSQFLNFHTNKSRNHMKITSKNMGKNKKKKEQVKLQDN